MIFIARINGFKREDIWDNYQDIKILITMLSGVVQNDVEIDKELLRGHEEMTNLVCKNLKLIHSNIKNSLEGDV